MASLNNLRKVGREELDQPKLAVIIFENKGLNTFRFVNVLNLSVKGVLIESDINFKKEFKLNLFIKNYELNQWDTFSCRAAWIQASDDEKRFSIGLEFLFHVENSLDSDIDKHDEISPIDLEYLLNNKLIKSIKGEGTCSFLNCLSLKTLKTGTQFITIGDKSDRLYIIQKGVCALQIRNQKKEAQTFAHRRQGDIIGEMSLLAGGLRTANVISESDMVLWELPRDKFDIACKAHPDICNFLTQLLTNRVENSIDIEVRNVGRYRMTHRIDKGKNSFICKGKHKGLNTSVAIKMMKHNQAMDRKFIQYFHKESKPIIQLNHPNIAQVYDIEEVYRTIFIIMEYLEGETLSALLNRKKVLPYSRIISFLVQISKGLSYAHDHGIIHEDITPGNIFILDNDTIKIIGTGLAFSQKEDFAQIRSFYYRSPEKIKGEKVAFPTDIYSLGIMAYEMFTGQMPFKENDITAMMKMHTDIGIPDPSIIVPDLPASIKNFIFKACAKSPEKRYNSMHEINNELLCITKELKMNLIQKTDTESEVTILHISHPKNQRLIINRFLDEFSQRAEDLDISIKIADKT
ncbi:MAG: protein kinase [Desulfobacteraceae bacterium]|nr:protein kinase [Desulfobacteraceae bacterium]